ncbi:uncharacterized protein [Drosophila bipectinata]|uniref:uncharacterized protein n=1 Tax=Drosophila bipectinata TaxID=42026 RepID=UPI001C8A18BB|nr:uncharacterized protein LOC108121323 [Drosophila bipectinata]
MQRSILLLLISVTVLSVAVALPLTLDEFFNQNLEASLNMDLAEKSGIRKRNAQDSSGSHEDPQEKPKASSEESKEKENALKRVRRNDSSGDSSGSSSEEKLKAAHSKAGKSGQEGPAGEVETETTTSDGIEETSHAPAKRRRRDVSEEHLEPELNPQAEKELTQEMEEALAALKKDKDLSIEDYAQGCEVQEVSSLEANDATYE